MKKRKILATGALMTAVLFTGSSPALAQSVKTPAENARSISPDGVAVYASDNFQEEESAYGRTAAEILAEQGFTPAQIQKLSSYRDSPSGKSAFSDEE